MNILRIAAFADTGLGGNPAGVMIADSHPDDAETPRLFHTRNPFASGGVYEGPATGAATAAFAGYLRDIEWPHQGSIEIIQDEKMGMRSRLRAEFSDEPGSSIRVSGNARIIEDSSA